MEKYFTVDEIKKIEKITKYALCVNCGHKLEVQARPMVLWWMHKNRPHDYTQKCNCGCNNPQPREGYEYE